MGSKDRGTSNTVVGDVHGTVVQVGHVAGAVHIHGATPQIAAGGTLAERPPWLARLPGAVLGAGTLLDEQHVITCAHVVDADAGILVEFPFAPDAVSRSAEVVERWPSAQDGSGDAVVLRLATPVELTPAPLAERSSLQGNEFWVHGFPGGTPAARQVHGKLGGAAGPAGEWVQVTADSPLCTGFSGSPVFARGAVAGIMVGRDGGHMLPVSTLCGRWPWLADRIGWRLDLDPSPLKTHWLPRARGSEVESDSGAWYFTGREAARQAVCDWLAAPERPNLVVVGGPGTGKSALLAHLLVAADPVLGREVPTSGPRPPARAFSVAVHIAGLNRGEVIARLAGAAGITAETPHELLVGLRERHRRGRGMFTVLADAVEEAASVEEARRIAALLRDLGAIQGVRVLAGVRTAPEGTERARILAAFGGTASRIDLESHEYQRNHDVSDYVEQRLTGEDAESTHYRDRPPEDLRRIARAVARKARYNFLIAQLATRWLTSPSTPPLDLADSKWEDSLPETVGQAMDTYLDTCGADTALVRRLLTALAFARGDGLPRDAVWLTLADALHPPHGHTPAELETVFHGAANYLVERAIDQGGNPRYRLYHDALDEHMRAQCLVPQPQRVITEALIKAVPGRRWTEAAPYVRTQLAGHAVQAGRLDELLDDIAFLIHAEPGPLLAALPHTSSEQARLVAEVYRLSNHRHRALAPARRCRVLALDAARIGAYTLQQRLNDAASTENSSLRWRVRFATGSAVHTSPVATFAVGGEVWADVTEINGRPVAVLVNGRDVSTWDLTEHYMTGSYPDFTIARTRLAIGEVDGRPVAIKAGRDNDPILSTLDDIRGVRPFWETNVRGGAPLSATGFAEVDGVPVAVISTFDNGLHVWDLTAHRVIARHDRTVAVLTVAEIHGCPVVLYIDKGNTLRVWNLVLRPPDGVPITTGGGVKFTAVDGGMLRGAAIAVTGAATGELQVWDMATHEATFDPLRGHTGAVTCVVVAEIDGRPIAVSGGEDTAVRVWDLETGAAIAEFFGHTASIVSVVVTTIDGVGLVLSGAEDGTARLWELTDGHTVGHPVAGHDHDIHALGVIATRKGPVAIVGSNLNGADACEVRVWSLRADHPAATAPSSHRGDVATVATTTIGGRIVFASTPIRTRHRNDDSCETRIWRYPGRFRGQVGAELGHGTPTVAVLDTVDDPRLRIAYSTASPGSNRRCEVQLAEITGAVHLDRATAAVITRLGNRPVIVVLRENKGVHLQNPTPIRRYRLSEARVLAFLRVGDGTVVVTGAPVGDSGPTKDSEPEEILPELPVPTDATTLLTAVLGDRPIVITGHADHTVRFWDLAERELLDEVTLPLPPRALGLSGSGHLVVCFGRDIAVFDTELSLTTEKFLGTRDRRRWWQRLRR